MGGSVSRHGGSLAATLGRLGALERAEARLFAAKAKVLIDLTGIAERRRELSSVEQFLSMEVAGTSLCGQGTAASRVLEAARLSENLPRTLELLGAGRLFVGQARALLQVTAHCTPEVSREVERRLLPAGAELNAVDLRRKARRLLISVEAELDAAAAAERAAKARSSRRVWARPDADGMTFLGALLPAENAAVFGADLDLLARRIRTADRAAALVGGPAARTLDQIRADVLATLPGLGLAAWDAWHAQGETGAAAAFGTSPLCRPDFPIGCRLPAAGRTVVNVHIPMSTALEIDNTAGYISGYGPVAAEHIRLLIPHAALRRVAVDEDTGLPLEVDQALLPPDPDLDLTHGRLLGMIRPWRVFRVAEDRHDPSAGLVRLIDVRDQHCTGPGCSIGVGRTEHDHLEPWPGGPTAAWNLKNHSQRCHRAKHHGWTVTTHTDGSATWASPTGRRYWRPSPHDPPPAIDNAARIPRSRRCSEVPPAGVDDESPLVESTPTKPTAADHDRHAPLGDESDTCPF